MEVKEYTYETFPDYDKKVEGAKEIVMTGNEIGVDYINDVVYDHKDGIDLHLQILQPHIFNKPNALFPLVVYIQGSAWRKQNIYRNVYNVGKLASLGYVCCIVEYRDSSIAKFPSCIIDGKNAIRYMLENYDLYHINKEQVIIMGDSSGGHTSTMIGMTARYNLFDEPINNESLNIKGIIDLYGAIDVCMEDGFPTTLNHQLLDSPEGQYLGYNIRENEQEAKKACSIYYANNEYAPMLILHGSKDKTVYIKQSVNLYNKLKSLNKDVEFYIVRNSDHGGPTFFSDESINIYDGFIKRCLEK